MKYAITGSGFKYLVAKTSMIVKRYAEMLARMTVKKQAVILAKWKQKLYIINIGNLH